MGSVDKEYNLVEDLVVRGAGAGANTLLIISRRAKNGFGRFSNIAQHSGSGCMGKWRFQTHNKPMCQTSAYNGIARLGVSRGRLSECAL